MCYTALSPRRAFHSSAARIRVSLIFHSFQTSSFCTLLVLVSILFFQTSPGMKSENIDVHAEVVMRSKIRDNLTFTSIVESGSIHRSYVVRLDERLPTNSVTAIVGGTDFYLTIPNNIQTLKPSLAKLK
ncbi:hypothetical protein L2E82_47944 [Cichorium intybus]|uniref:Uncharacterized protein n=1 Tax=Cichorium intybus TaxID=13427 RepID=A0ACB8YWS2_CICIN|nr:hypothetical protein L2E82_47944 [Cichorium intybus]